MVKVVERVRSWCAIVAVAVVVAGCKPAPHAEVASTRSALTTTNGLNQNGLSTNGLISNGFWANGFWANGFWANGFWANGFWANGFWANGFWANGFWANGVGTNGFWANGFWANGFWANGLTGTDAVRGDTLRNSPYARQLLQYIYSCAMPKTTYDTTLDPNEDAPSCARRIRTATSAIRAWTKSASSPSRAAAPTAAASPSTPTGRRGGPTASADETLPALGVGVRARAHERLRRPRRDLDARAGGRTEGGPGRPQGRRRRGGADDLCASRGRLLRQHLRDDAHDAGAGWRQRTGDGADRHHAAVLRLCRPWKQHSPDHEAVLLEPGRPGGHQRARRLPHGRILQIGICAREDTSESSDTRGTVNGCLTSATGPATRYDEVITVYLRQPIAVCGNGEVLRRR